MENQSSIYLYEPGSLNTTGGVYMEQITNRMNFIAIWWWWLFELNYLIIHLATRANSDSFALERLRQMSDFMK